MVFSWQGDHASNANFVHCCNLRAIFAVKRFTLGRPVQFTADPGGIVRDCLCINQMDTNPLNTDQLGIWWQHSLEGDSQAFYYIHRELFKGLYNYALKLLQDNDLANDAVQELFVKIWTKRADIGKLHRVKPYFFTVLRRQIFNQLRNLQLRELRISRIPRPDIDFSPEEIVVKNEEYLSLQKKISALLNELPKRQKEVIYLHYFEEMDYALIAAIMGINYQSVLNLTQKALQKLRTADLLPILLSLSCLCRMLDPGAGILTCLSGEGIPGLPH